ncbi:NAD-dependent epimerase/dehydratase family protein [Mesorhizobium captivum]|uniref:NAD-dependent epimerase/dehydratase family protein n=1 Tax=Mesorhizobium captivum TaxID=3072319 RepID=UPI002A23A517|nr:NAD-dependent epimerase/dehydratase family protein [Mesorhizobium sp. VK22E]MDX8507717.1 NAD-dependent epimerase/dehydratase family protein [Mesorhizobium sp. VK22E]
MGEQHAIFVSGAAGFVGSRLARIFVDRGFPVFGFDNLSRGSRENLNGLLTHERFIFEKVDLSDAGELRSRFMNCHRRIPISEVWHMAANSDIPAGIADASVDLRDTFLSTFNLLDAMKEAGVPLLAFASSSAVYGDLGEAPIREDIGPLLPISNYGAMKLASEALISAAVENWLSRALIFRFPNVIGVPATHGVILDFVRKLTASPTKLNVLGSGRQRKAYLHVNDLIDAIVYLRANASERFGCYNVGPEDKGVTVSFIAETTVEAVAPGAGIEYGLEDRGWTGDVPRFSYDIAKLRALGWRPQLGSADAVRKAVVEIVQQEGHL